MHVERWMTGIQLLTYYEVRRVKGQKWVYLEVIGGVKKFLQ